MPRRMTENESQEFLAEPRIGVLSVARGSDRAPHTTPVWYAYQPGKHHVLHGDARPQVPQVRTRRDGGRA